MVVHKPLVELVLLLVLLLSSVQLAVLFNEVQRIEYFVQMVAQVVEVEDIMVAQVALVIGVMFLLLLVIQMEAEEVDIYMRA